MADKSTSKTDRLVGFLSLWIARLALTVLAVAGLSHLLDGVDPMIKWPVTVVSVAFLLKETL
jgi:uncharacterized membrane protein YhhN